jgi:hypothetical protein
VFQPPRVQDPRVEDSYSKETFETVAVAENRAAAMTRSSPFSKFLTEMNEKINKQLLAGEVVDTIDTDANLEELQQVVGKAIEQSMDTVDLTQTNRGGAMRIDSSYYSGAEPSLSQIQSSFVSRQ